jgi:pilus assembly protein FimV
MTAPEPLRPAPIEPIKVQPIKPQPILRQEASSGVKPEAQTEMNLSFELPSFELPSFVAEVDLPKESNSKKEHEAALKSNSPLNDFQNLSFDMNLPDDVPSLNLMPTSQSLDFDAPLNVPSVSVDSEVENELKTMLELAKAYLEMGDRDGAKELLNEIIQKGSPSLVSVAQQMMAGLI